MSSIKKEIRRLENRWRTGNGWPKRLEWLEITNIRGWEGQKIEFNFPIVAIVGENGAGKSSVLQAAASVYRASQGVNDRFASEYFPKTPFENITKASIRYSYKQGDRSHTGTVRKPGERWRGNRERPIRDVIYIDLSRIQPLSGRSGYQKLLKHGVSEGMPSPFIEEKVKRISGIMGKTYSAAGFCSTSVDEKRLVPILQSGDNRYSGFHQGAGEIAAAELLQNDFPKYSLVLIDEIETSLHPRAQRRLIRDIIEISRKNEIQVILTTHSPFILDEIPPEGRIYIFQGQNGKEVASGVSPEFAMTKMDEENHPECDVYVEDKRASDLVSEVIISYDRNLRHRVQIIPFGTASVGKSLGSMVKGDRFPRPSVVFLDGDQDPCDGCVILPGEDAPERVVMEDLQKINWGNVSLRIGRNASETIDALSASMTLADHHDWISDAADKLTLGTDILWTALCSEWTERCLTDEMKEDIIEPIKSVIGI